MKKNRNISLLLAVMGVMLCAGTSHAQVTATARITLTVVPGPAFSIAPSIAQSHRSSAAIVGKSSEVPGVTFRSTGNLLVQLSSVDAVTSRFNLQDGQMRTFTAKDLKSISKVEVVYLGS